MGENLLKDPAIEEWVWMRQNTHRYFKINRRTAPTLIGMCLVVPAITFYFGYATQGLTELGPKTKKAWAEAYAERK
ncbi:hypothetical protein H4R18_005868 [Coemansia javaensis]|uniref:NADH dehydrogenase [ubiquinone] 1 beta subcomplex subunit 4 n=1 Tax=Coemansia javaensis TaxID=2761396 RepID=A0A9W8LEX9_9FUNG|nr:hypothetical protein H4R18_005868 [Coemansia javaensis]